MAERTLGFVKDWSWLRRARWIGIGAFKTFATLVALAPIGLYLECALGRITFPFDLEWMEGSMVDHVARVLAHKSVYVEPNLEFTPFIYNPVFYYVSAAVAWVVGLDYTALRAVSLAASLLSFLLLFEICRRETRSISSGAAAAGLFAATYKLTGAWFDVGRVDSLAITWCLLAAYCVRFGQKNRTLALGGLFAALMFGTKQSLLPVIPLFIGYLALFEGWRKAVWFGTTSIGVSLASMLALHVGSDGWYLRYTFLFPRGHDMDFIKLREWQLETSGSLIFAVALALAFVLSGANMKSKAFYVGLGVTLIWLAWYSRIHGLSYINVNMPAHVALALLAGLGLGSFERRDTLTAVGATAALLCQLALLRYNSREFVPKAADVRAARDLSAIISSFQGEVYMPHHGFAAAKVGRGTFAHDIAVVDVERTTSASRETRERVRNQVKNAIGARRFAAIILDYDSVGNLPGLHRHYKRAPFDIGSSSALHTPVGLRVRPSILYVPR